jgi:polysaccharide chain length determinant protein (PEP-CTERM system associated)
MSDSDFDYRKFLELVVRRKELFVKLALLIMTAAIIVSYVLPKQYEASSTVFIEKNVINELVKGITVTPSMDDTIKVLTYAITSRTLLNRVADSLDMNVTRKGGTEMDEFYKKLQKNTVVRVKGNNLFTISYTDGDPSMARDFTNTLVRLYIEENTSSKRGESYGATKFLSEQIDTFRQKLEKADKDLNDFKREKGGVIAVDEAKLFEEINVSQQKLYDLELRRRQLEGMRKVTRKSSDPLQTRLSALQRRLDELRVQYMDSYPEIIQIKADMDTIRTQLKTRGATYQPLDPQEIEKIESEIAALKASEASLRRYIATNQGLLRSLPSAKAQLERLEAEKVNQKNIYDQLYARHGQSEVSKQMEVQDKSTTFRVVDPAILPQKPIRPNRLMIMFLGIVGGLAGSFGVLYLMDQMDDTVRDVDFLKGLGVPLLAVISRIHVQREIDMQRRRTKRLCTYAGLYFLFLLFFPLSELMGLTFMDSVVDYLRPANLVQNVKDQVR